MQKNLLFGRFGVVNKPVLQLVSSLSGQYGRLLVTMKMNLLLLGPPRVWIPYCRAHVCVHNRISFFAISYLGILTVGLYGGRRPSHNDVSGEIMALPRFHMLD